MEEYQKSLTEIEKKTFKIAENHLKTSFSMEKSIGYLKFIEKKASSSS